MPSFIDLTGQRFGRLIVTGRKESRIRSGKPCWFWECQCDCGERSFVRAGDLRSGNTTSCGCFERELWTARNITTRSIKPEFEAELVSLYENGATLRTLSKRYNAHLTTIHTWVHKLGARIRSQSESCRKYAIDEHVFDCDTPESHYWIGFLMADGCIKRTRSSYALVVALAESDKGHLSKLRSFLKSDYPIRTVANRGYGQGKNLCLFAATSTALAESLRRYGITPNKTGRERVPMALANDRDVWRGLIDGDGWVGCQKGKPVLGFTGNRNICEQFRAVVNLITGRRLSLHPNHSIWKLTLTSSAAAVMLKWLYGNCCAALDRKLTTANACSS